MNRKEAASLLVSGLAITSGVLSAGLTLGATTAAPLIISEGLKAFGGLGGGFVGNVFLKHFIEKHPQDDVLKNGDLTRAIGSAIFRLCDEFTKYPKYQKDHKCLKKLAETELETWENLILGGEYVEGKGLVFSDIDLEDISAEKAVQFFDAQAEKLDEIKTLTPQTWQNILKTLCEKRDCTFSAKTSEELSEHFYKNFAKALREILKADFNKDGKAYAGMQFRLLSEILYYTKENYELTDSILPIVINILNKVEDINQTAPKNYAPENKANWEKIFAKFDSFIELQKKTFENTEKLVEYAEKGDKKLDKILENQVNPAKSAKPKPQVLINLPREKNDFFVEQGNILARLALQLEEHHLAYLHGTHGLGKTTTLLEYAYAHEKEYDFIFYVLATDEAIEGELAWFADEFLENVSKEETRNKKAEIVRDYLSENARWTKESKNWLIIFDNLESVQWIDKYFPKSTKGDCLYACNNKIHRMNDREVEFEQFSQEESELFLYKKVSGETDIEHKNIASEELKGVREVISQIGKIPLALNIAGSYIRETGVSYTEYVELIKANIKKHLKFKDEHKEHQSETAFDAFSVSLDQIKKVDADDEDGEIKANLAETILDLYSFCAPEDIPEELIERSLFKAVDTSATTTPPKALFREALTILKKFDLIRERKKIFKYKHLFDKLRTLADGTKDAWEFREAEENVFDTYRTLQNILSIKLSEETKKVLVEYLVESLSDILPESENSEMSDNVKLEELELYEKYVASAILIIQAMEKHKVYIANGVRISNDIGNYLCQVSKFKQSELCLETAKAIVENLFGIEHFLTATVYNNLATLYRSQKKNDKVESLFREGIKIREKAYGKENFNTATSYNNLAEFLLGQSKLEEAESHFIKVKEILEKVAPKHENMASTYNNLAVLYDAKKDYSEAEKYYIKGLNLMIDLLGEFHNITALSYANLGLHYYDCKKYEEAEKFYKRAIHIREKILSEEYSNALLTYHSLITLYTQQQRFEEAEPLLQKSLEITQQIFDGDYSETIAVKSLLADVYRQQGKSIEAKPLYEEIIPFYENQEVKNITAIAVYNQHLALVYQSLNENEKAQLYFEKAKPMFEKIYGKNNLNTIMIHYQLAESLQRQEKYKEAAPLYKKAIKFLEKQPGDNIDWLHTLYNNFANNYRKQKNYKKADPLYKDSLAFLKKTFGDNHEYTAIVSGNYARSLFEQGKVEEAWGISKNALAILKNKFPDDHPHVKKQEEWNEEIKEKMKEKEN